MKIYQSQFLSLQIGITITAALACLDLKTAVCIHKSHKSAKMCQHQSRYPIFLDRHRLQNLGSQFRFNIRKLQACLGCEFGLRLIKF